MQKLTSRNLFESREFKDSQEARVQQIIEKFLAPLQQGFDSVGNKKKIREKQLKQLEKLRMFALLNIPTAIAFYRGLFVYEDGHLQTSWGSDADIKNKILANAQEVAVKIKDPYILMCIVTLKTDDPSHLDLENGFFCLQEASKLEGIDATRATYYLANCYADELMSFSSNTDSMLTSYYREVMRLIRNHKINFEDAIRNLRALEKMESVEAKLFLSGFAEEPRNARELIDQFNLHQLNQQQTEYAQELSRKRNELLKQAKERFLTYFDLALNKVIEEGYLTTPASYFPPNTIVLDLFNLIQLDVAKGPQAVPDVFQHYYQIFEARAQENKIAALYAIVQLEKSREKPNTDLIHATLTKLVSKWSYNQTNLIIAQAAVDLAASSKDSVHKNQLLEKAAQLGHIWSATNLAIDEFDNDPQKSLEYFKLITKHAYLFDPIYSIAEKEYILETLQKNKSFDTDTKIEYYL